MRTLALLEVIIRMVTDELASRMRHGKGHTS